MRRLVMSRSMATLRDAKRPSYTTVVSFKSEISGRTSPVLSSDMNGSRPPPSYENTSRNNVCGCAAIVSDARSACCAAAGSANATNASATLAACTRSSGRLTRGGRRRLGRLHEGANREFGEQQRTRRVAQQLLRSRRGGREGNVLRHDDARQRRDISEVFADLIVVAVDLKPVPIGVERRTGLGAEWLNLAEGDPANLGFGRDVVDQRRDLVALRHQPPHQLERALIFFDAPPQIVDAPTRQVRLRRGDDSLETIGLRIRRPDLLHVGRVLLRPEEVAARPGDEDEQRHDLAALVGRSQCHAPTSPTARAG